MATNLIQQQIIYSDFHDNFNKQPISKDLAVLTNEEAVKRSIKNLLMTDFYERPFQPNVGSQIRASLFQNFSPITIMQIQTYIEQCINNWEPRASLIQVIVQPHIDQNAYTATVYFYVKNSPTPVELNLFWKRVR